MPITETMVDGRVVRRGSQTYDNGMTLTFHGPDEHMPNCVRLLDMKHARSWLASDGGEPVYVDKEGEEDMGGRGKYYSVGNLKTTYVSGRGKVYNYTAAESEALRKGLTSGWKSAYKRKRDGSKTFAIDR